MNTELHIAPRAPEFPAMPGLRFRGWRGLDDIPGMADVAAAATRAAGSAETRSVETMLAQYRNLANCDPDRDIVLAEVDGTPVAYARTWWADRNEGGRAFEAVSFIDPAFADRGIEDVLLAIGARRQEALAAEMADELDGRRVFLARFVNGPEPSQVERLERAGFVLARRYAQMVRPDFEAIPALPEPEGLELRRADPADDTLVRRVWEMGDEVFREHFGTSHQTDADWRKFIESPETQPALWCLAIDAASGELAGHILNYLGEPEADGTIVGWTESIAVRAPYRRRGLAGAMLAQSLRIVRDAGAARAALGVDQQNPNQAMTLYQRLGFEITMEELEFHRDITPGDRSTAEPVVGR
jgi:mycothiol synthase